MVDMYAELHGDAMRQSDGSSFRSITTQRGWAVAPGVDKDGSQVVRVFGISNEERKGLNSKGLREPGVMESLTQSGGHVDLPTPDNLDQGMFADAVLDRLNRFGAHNEDNLKQQGSRALLGMYGVSDSAAADIADRGVPYEQVVGVLDKAFDGEGPNAFAGKESKHMAVLRNVKEDLGAGKVVDQSFTAQPPAAQGDGRQHLTTTVTGLKLRQ